MLGTRLVALVSLAAALAIVVVASPSLAAVSVTASAGTLGPTSYSTLELAFSAINAGTHRGDIRISITSNTVESSATATLNSSGAGSASYTSVIIQPSVDNVTLSGPTATGGFGLVQLNGADNVMIDGDNPNTTGINRNLTITPSSSSTAYKSVIRIATSAATPSADNITIRNVNINGTGVSRNSSTNTSTTTATETSFGIYAGGNGGSAATGAPAALNSVTANPAIAGTTVNNFVVANNAINQCGRGIVFNGAATSVSTGVSITGNVIGAAGAASPSTPPFTTPATTVYSRGIWVSGTAAVSVTGNTLQNIMSYVTAATIGIELVSPLGTSVAVTGNVIGTVAKNFSSSTSDVVAKGIAVNASSSLILTGNRVTNVQSVAPVFGTCGIEATGNVTSGTIAKNVVATVYNRAGSTPGAYGLNIAGASGLLVANNMISDVRQTMASSVGFTTTSGVFGIRVASGTNLSFYHNSVNLTGSLFGSSISNQLSAAFAILSTASSGCDVRNNVFSNTLIGGSTRIAHVAVYLPASANSSMNLTLDYNAYVCGMDPARGGLAQVGTGTGGLYPVVGFDPTSTTPATNLRSYTRTLSLATSNDSHSIGISGGLPFATSTDLHLADGTATPLAARAVVVAGVTDDIDGQGRPGPPLPVSGGGQASDLGADEFDGRPIPWLGLDRNPIECTTSVRFVATVPAGASGSIQFGDDAADFGTAAVVGGNATLSTNALVVGNHNMHAGYGGDAQYPAATSTSVALNVVELPTETALSVSQGLIFVGDPTVLSATVAPANSTGSVEFLDTGQVIGAGTVVDGEAHLTATFSQAGLHNLKAHYVGDGCRAASLSPQVAKTIESNPVLTTSPNPSPCGAKVVVTANVSISATGTIELRDGSVSRGESPVADGVAMLSLSDLVPGSHTFVATYSGDDTHPSTVSAPYVHHAGGIGTATTIAVARTPLFAGDPVVLTGAVTPSDAAGLMEFLDGEAVINSAAIVSGTASLSTTFTGGQHELRARYVANACDSASISAPLSQTVYTKPLLTSNAGLVACGTKVQFTAFVRLGATGTIDFVVGGVSRGVIAIVDDSATLSLSDLPPGDNVAVAVYSGDDNHPTESSDPYVQKVLGVSTSTSLVVNPGPNECSRTLIATVSPSNAADSVRFTDGGVLVGVAVVFNGVGAVQRTFARGQHVFKAAHNGGGCNLPGESSPKTVTIGATPSVSLTSDGNPAAVGQKVTLIARVTPSNASGTVTFLEQGQTIGASSLVNGVATLSRTFASPGNRLFTARYEGDSCSVPSVSPVFTQGVVEFFSSTALTSNINPLTCGNTVRLTATVTPTVSEGTVTFKDGTTILGVAGVANGSAFVNVHLVTLGTHSLVAVFSGTSTMTPSTSPIYMQAVAPPWIADPGLTADHTPAVGEQVVLTAFVNPANSPGDFEFLDGSVSLGYGPIVNGTTSITVTFNRAGRHFLRSVYSGTDCIEGQTSDYLIQMVNPAAVQPAAAMTTATRVFQFAIDRITPNPVRRAATIDYGVAHPANVGIRIVDVQGRVVETLVSGLQRAGQYQVRWNARGEGGRVPAGVYFVRYEVPGKVLVKRFVLQ